MLAIRLQCLMIFQKSFQYADLVFEEYFLFVSLKTVVLLTILCELNIVVQQFVPFFTNGKFIKRKTY